MTYFTQKIVCVANFEEVSSITFEYIPVTTVKIVFNSKHSERLKFFASSWDYKFIFLASNTQNLPPDNYLTIIKTSN